MWPLQPLLFVFPMNYRRLDLRKLLYLGTINTLDHSDRST